MSRGRGIKLFTSIDELSSEELETVALAQEYVDDLTLIDGHKFDFRVYVLITTTDPLLVYIYPEALGRVAYHKYQSPSEKNERDSMMHLTNAAINNDWSYS